MTKVILQIERDEDLRLLLELVHRLNLGVIQVSPEQQSVISPDRQKMINYIMTYTNENPSYGDAGLWQQQERQDRELPWQP
ncbi:MAG: hypothetical protein JNK77_00190 [Saprospiraceae bacterium]|nr:hypothetical protein [Saprospiraceae bacterium]